MHKLLVIFFFLMLKVGFTQQEITWETLRDVTFEDKYYEAEDAYYYYPTFGETVKALKGKEIIIKGYMIVIDPEKGYYFLSKNPNSSCYFCGAGGPESVMELYFKLSENLDFKMDQVVTLKGTLNLNAEDVYHCNYLLKKAEVYSD